MVVLAAMLSYDIRSLESQAVVVDAHLAPDDPVWEADDPRPSAPLHITGRLSAAGPDRFYWHGVMAGTVMLPCRRCLADTTARVHDEAHLIFASTDDEETDDPDVYQLDPRSRELDLRPALREQWLLAAPGFALCRDECQGICPRCGADRNAGSCGCPPSSDSRWDALRGA
jgi:uncharacterized protein